MKLCWNLNKLHSAIKIIKNFLVARISLFSHRICFHLRSNGVNIILKLLTEIRESLWILLRLGSLKKSWINHITVLHLMKMNLNCLIMMLISVGLAKVLKNMNTDVNLKDDDNDEHEKEKNKKTRRTQRSYCQKWMIEQSWQTLSQSSINESWEKKLHVFMLLKKLEHDKKIIFYHKCLCSFILRNAEMISELISIEQ